jgi:hypothetical protein
MWISLRKGGRIVEAGDPDALLPVRHVPRRRFRGRYDHQRDMEAKRAHDVTESQFCLPFESQITFFTTKLGALGVAKSLAVTLHSKNRVYF